MSRRFNIVEFAEILVLGLLWPGVWVPVFFALIRAGEALGPGTTTGSKGAFELSFFVACLISLAVMLCRFHPTPILSGSASPQRSRPRILKGPVRDAAQ